MKEKYVVFSLKMANALVEKGFTLLKTGINFNKPEYKVFIFKNCPELHEAMRQLKD